MHTLIIQSAPAFSCSPFVYAKLQARSQAASKARQKPTILGNQGHHSEPADASPCAVSAFVPSAAAKSFASHTKMSMARISSRSVQAVHANTGGSSGDAYAAAGIQQTLDFTSGSAQRQPERHPLRNLAKHRQHGHQRQRNANGPSADPTPASRNQQSEPSIVQVDSHLAVTPPLTCRTANGVEQLTPTNCFLEEPHNVVPIWAAGRYGAEHVAEPTQQSLRSKYGCQHSPLNDKMQQTSSPQHASQLAVVERPPAVQAPEGNVQHALMDTIPQEHIAPPPGSQGVPSSRHPELQDHYRRKPSRELQVDPVHANHAEGAQPDSPQKQAAASDVPGHCTATILAQTDDYRACSGPPHPHHQLACSQSTAGTAAYMTQPVPLQHRGWSTQRPSDRKPSLWARFWRSLFCHPFNVHHEASSDVERQTGESHVCSHFVHGFCVSGRCSGTWLVQFESPLRHMPYQ